MLEKILGPLVSLLLQLIPNDILKKELAAFLDNIESAIKNSSTKIDDITLLPVIAIIRSNLSLPDYNKQMPGDYNNRIQYIKDYAETTGKTLTENNWNDLRAIILAPGVWQPKIKAYIDALKKEFENANPEPSESN